MLGSYRDTSLYVASLDITSDHMHKHCWTAMLVPEHDNSNSLRHSTCVFFSSGATESLRGDASVPQQPSLENVKDSAHWAAYKASLDRHGYFQGNIPGSAQHKQLLAQALQTFAQSEAYMQSAADAAAPGEAIAAILREPIDVELFQVLPFKTYQAYQIHPALPVMVMCHV